MLGQPLRAICVPIGRKEGIVELLEKVTGVEDLVTLNVGIGNSLDEEGATFVGMGRPSDIGKVPFVPVGVGKVTDLVIGYRGLPVPFRNGGGRRPDTDALKLLVKLKVGVGSKPELGAVGFRVKLENGVGRAETDLKE